MKGMQSHEKFTSVQGFLDNSLPNLHHQYRMRLHTEFKVNLQPQIFYVHIITTGPVKYAQTFMDKNNNIILTDLL